MFENFGSGQNALYTLFLVKDKSIKSVFPCIRDCHCFGGQISWNGIVFRTQRSSLHFCIFNYLHNNSKVLYVINKLTLNLLGSICKQMCHIYVLTKPKLQRHEMLELMAHFEYTTGQVSCTSSNKKPLSNLRNLVMNDV